MALQKTAPRKLVAEILPLSAASGETAAAAPAVIKQEIKQETEKKENSRSLPVFTTTSRSQSQISDISNTLMARRL